MQTNAGPLALCYYNFGPYHLARLEALTKIAKARGLEVIGIELASQGKGHPWHQNHNQPQLDIQTLFPGLAVEDIPFWRSIKKMWTALNRFDPQALGISGYTKPAMLTALAWARWKRRVAIILMVSKADDKPRRFLLEWVKKRIMALFDGALVAGTPQREYARQLGLAPQRIFMNHNVIDTHYFIEKANWSRQNARQLRQQYHLPDNYFLIVSRLEEKKNISRFFEAYAQYWEKPDSQRWSLVLCGAGSLEPDLKQKARRLGMDQVHFVGFKQMDELPIYYGLARCFIIPSSHFEQWGLVVNEAMASGLPVLVSRACGCARDLVQEGVNGYTFDPYDVAGLAQLMDKMSSGEHNLKAMGEASLNIIAHWTPEVYGENFLKLIEAVTPKSLTSPNAITVTP
jgi:1,2-diacylglycerol 3-alpha-glucosyltransferase